MNFEGNRADLNKTQLRNQIQAILIKEKFGEEPEVGDPEYNAKVGEWLISNRKRISDMIENDPTTAERWANDPQSVLEQLR